MNTAFWALCALLLADRCWWVGQGMLQGQRINAVAYPWVAGLVDGHTWLGVCSGAIIHPHFVLTATSCFLVPGTRTQRDKKRFVVVAPTRVNQVRSIEVFVFPSHSVFDFQTAGLIGVKRAFNIQPGRAERLRIWSWDKEILSRQYRYIFDNAGFLSCTVVAWRNEGPILISGSQARTSAIEDEDDTTPIINNEGREEEEYYENAYDVKAVSSADVQIVDQQICQDKWCSNMTRTIDCEVLLNKSMCVKTVDPPRAFLCGADQGASLACSEYVWGVLTLHDRDCSNSSNGVQYPLLFRLDFALEFINGHREDYPEDSTNLSPRLLSKPVTLLCAQYMIFVLKLYRSI